MGDADVKKELGSLISFLEHEEDPWGIKDLKSEFIYANNLDYLNLPKNFKIEGLLDSQLPHPVAELAPKLQEHDKRVMQGQKLIPVIQTHFYHSEHKLQPYLFEKRPYYNERDELIGTIYHGKKLSLFSLQRYITGLTPSVLMLEPPNELFTKKELMVIFFTLQGLTSKEVARKMYRSPRTIENKLQDIYEKIKCHSIKYLREYCHHEGLDCYVPPQFLFPEVKFLS